MPSDDHLAATAAIFGIPSVGIWKSYIVIPKFMAVASMVASAFLARDILGKWREKKETPLNNVVLFGLSVVNIVGSFFTWFMTTWMVPRGDAPYAAGNQATCTVQGFFVATQFIYFVTAYTLLAALYMLVVRYSWTEGYMKQARIRWTFTLLPIVVSLSFAVVPLFYGMYNLTRTFCYLAPYPPGCRHDPDVDCVRGENATLVQTIEFGYTMLCNAAIVLFMMLLVHSVHARERRLDRYAVDGQRASRTQTRKTAWHGVRYIGGFTLSYFWVYIFMGWNIAGEAHVRSVGVYYLNVVLNPLAGFFNALVYFSPRYDVQRELRPESSRMDSILYVLNLKAPSLCCMGCCEKGKSGLAESGLTDPLTEENE